MKIRKYFLLLLVCFVTLTTYSQKFGVGASAMYNFQTESIGAGIRAEFPFNNFSIVPQISYYPGFNKINEYYAGVSVHCNLFNIHRWIFYALVSGAYNAWINYQDSPMKNAKYSNWDLEGGLGVKTSNCIRPFLEYRYNLHWKETNIQLGFMYFFHCQNSKSKNYKKLKNKLHICPAYED